MIDNFSNCLTCIRNGLTSQHVFVNVARSRRLIAFLLFIVKQGYLCGISFPQHNRRGDFRVFLKYDGTKPVISGIFRISRPSRRVCVNTRTLKRIYSPNILFIVSTNLGYLTAFQALRANVGGELVCLIY